MPKGRMLNKKISQDDKVAKLSLRATLLYTWCIPHLDVEGRIYGDVWTLKSIVPHVEEITTNNILSVIEEWIKADLVFYYGDNSHKYLSFKGFMSNQILNPSREAKSEIPPPTQLQSNSGVTPEEVKLSKDKLSKDNIYVDFEKSTLTTWDSFCAKHPHISKILKVSGSRRQKLQKRWHEGFKLEEVLPIAEKSRFLLGENDRKWQISFDWLIENDKNYLKVLEEKYSDKQNEDDLRAQFGLTSK